MKHFPFKILILIIILSGCKRKTLPDFSDQINYSKTITKIQNLDRREKIDYIRYYNQFEQLIEEVGLDYRVKFYYDKKGKLLEEFYCREYNCEVGKRKILVYDNFENQIGHYWTTDTLVKHDTSDFKQTKFYDSKNRIIKNLHQSGTKTNNEYFEHWKHSVYDNNNILLEFITSKSDTIQRNEFAYDKNDNLILVIKKDSVKTVTEKYEYDENGLLQRKETKSNKEPIRHDLIFNVNNCSILYKYDDQKRIIEEKTFNHRGELYRSFIFEYN